MAQEKGSSRSRRLGADRVPAPEEDPKPLMAEIDVASGQKPADDPVMGQMGDNIPNLPEIPPVVPVAPVMPPTERWGRLMSRMDYPVEVGHQEGAIRLSPRAIQRVDGNKIAHVDGKMVLPKGVNFVPDRR